MEDKVILEIKTPKEGEETPEAMMGFLSSLVTVNSPLSFLNINPPSISLEITSIDQTIRFYLVIPTIYQAFIESQIVSQYPKAQIVPVDRLVFDKAFSQTSLLSPGFMKLQHGYQYPLKTFEEFKSGDTMAALVGAMSKFKKDEAALVQLLLIPAHNRWQRAGQAHIENRKLPDPEKEAAASDMYLQSIADKITLPGFKVAIRLLVKSPETRKLELLAACFNSFNNVNGNSLSLRKPLFWQKGGFIRAVLGRSKEYVPWKQILNVKEIATIFHLPTKQLEGASNIYWAKTILSNAPENLPIAIDKTDKEKQETNFFARTGFKNSETTFGIKKSDRRKHIYLIGKTGTGKSTLIANMAINDMRNGEGLAIIDPHGDLSEILLDYVPKSRINDIVYLNPSDLDHPFHLNPLEVSSQHKELVASGIVSIFNKLYIDSWGPRLEYILRNTILTLLEVPDSTLLMVPQMLTNQRFRKKIAIGLEDPVLRSFWLDEFEGMSDRLRSDAISPILNKVGQFIASPIIRNIIGHPKSTIRLEDFMNQGKIVILNLSQGKIGEDNSALLGAMIITKLQLAAMNRVYMLEDDRRDFYLYVDEFQNFATTSFIKILSEARKYRLCLTLANQYINQLTPEVRSSIFGNAGTLMTFVVGAEDTPILAKEFGERFTEPDLMALGNYQMLIKMSIDGFTSVPFWARTLPLPRSKNQNREKVLRVSLERYTKVKGDTSKPKIDEPLQTLDDTDIEKTGTTAKNPDPVTKPKLPTAIPAPRMNTKEIFERLIR